MKKNTVKPTPEVEAIFNDVINGIPKLITEWAKRNDNDRTLPYHYDVPSGAKAVGLAAISEEEAKKYVYQYAGLGHTDVEEAAQVSWYEFVNADKPIGKYFEQGEWRETHRMQIIYSKKGVHSVPVKEQ